MLCRYKEGVMENREKLALGKWHYFGEAVIINSVDTVVVTKARVVDGHTTYQISFEKDDIHLRGRVPFMLLARPS